MEQNSPELKIPEEFEDFNIKNVYNINYGSNYKVGKDETNMHDFTIIGLRLYLYPKKVQDFIHFTSVCIDDKEDDKIVHYVLKDYESHTAHKTYRYSQFPDKKIKQTFLILRRLAYGGYLQSILREDAWDDKKDTISNNLRSLGVYVMTAAEELYRLLNNLEPLPERFNLKTSAIKNVIALYNFQVNEEDEEE